MLKRKIKYFIIIMALSASCTNKNSEKTIRKGEFTLIGNFSSDLVPEGTIKFYDSLGNLRSVKNYKNGLLDGESYTYYSNGKSQSSLRFEGNKEMGFKSIFDSLGHLIYKSNFFYGKEIGEVYAFDTFNNVTEYSFNNFEDDILYYSKYDPDTKKYSYPGDSYLIKANTSMVSLNGHDGASVFLYLFRPPKLRLSYSIAYFNQKDSP